MTGVYGTTLRGEPLPPMYILSTNSLNEDDYKIDPRMNRGLPIVVASYGKLSWKCHRHVVTCQHDMTFHSIFGQMGPCRRHDIEDVVAFCVGLSQHLPDFPKCNMYGVMIITLIALSSRPLLVLSMRRPLIV